VAVVIGARNLWLQRESARPVSTTSGKAEGMK